MVLQSTQILLVSPLIAPTVCTPATHFSGVTAGDVSVVPGRRGAGSAGIATFGKAFFLPCFRPVQVVEAYKAA